MLQIALWKRVTVVTLCLCGVILALPNLFYSRVERAEDARAAIEAGQESAENRQAAILWPSWLPASLVNLGLDLRGGAHLLVEVRREDVHAQRMKALWPELRDALRSERAVTGTIRRLDSPADQLLVRISRSEGMARAIEVGRGLAQPVTGLGTFVASQGNDLDVGASGDVLRLSLSQAERAATDERTMRQSIEIIRRRIDEMGTREPAIQRQGADRILVQVPGLGSADELKAIIGTTAQLTFQPVVRRLSNISGPEQLAGVRAGTGNEALPSLDEPDTAYVLEAAAVVTGEDLVDAQPSFDENGRPAVSFRFNPSGARRFGDYTAENVGNPFAIVLDGEVISAPVIQSHIPGGSGIITGNFTVEESTRLAVLLRAGALPAGLDFLEERTIGPELGADSIAAGRLACLVAFAAVLVFMPLCYGLFGVFANIALILNVALMLGMLGLIGATLTLPGIAGIVLTIGMAVDANVLIFERIREEALTARGPARAIELGYEKALGAILDANITTFIAALILFGMGAGPVQGFAVTLGLGIVTSVFTAIFVTRLLVVFWFERVRPRQIKV